MPTTPVNPSDRGGLCPRHVALGVDAVAQDVAFRMVVEYAEAAANHGLIVDRREGEAEARRIQVFRLVEAAGRSRGIPATSSGSC